MADRHVARQVASVDLVEGLADEPHAAVRAAASPSASTRHDAGALLAPVLQRVEAEVGEPGRVGIPETPMMPHMLSCPRRAVDAGGACGAGIASK